MAVEHRNTRNPRLRYIYNRGGDKPGDGAMLTDIFADRYDAVTMFPSFGLGEVKLMVQSFRMVEEQLFPYYDFQGKERADSKATYESLNRRISMELGLPDISQRHYSYQANFNGQATTQWGAYTPVMMAKNFMLQPLAAPPLADRHVKERLSYIELAFRQREADIAQLVAKLPERLLLAGLPRRGNMLIPGDPSEADKVRTQSVVDAFAASVAELNERLVRANAKLQYHNGFIQPFGDELTAAQIEEPFWKILKDPVWTNVDIDMKEAVERRDNLERDPGFYALRALESVIKIISGEKGWTTGKERGAASYIDNLVASPRRFIDVWEKDSLLKLFGVRNDLGHGPGSQPMPSLSLEQTNWVIDTAMAWIRSLVARR